ncbi:NAD(P)/FAD-dependent oxidoreductase [Billgrantia gudaonensis]|uniref:Amine oxidase domain-containing protein n=1 Tax=Billgrantia gudaonensis TaxID=376427 RepID=A0A1G9C5H7_9GAMM|nr:FAD-dependent oxidoreductase [Halomonas gudaonensis]SDK46896.1 hypothetical protein SAMN04487954_11729 [Halomonas gudaonensis]
MTTIDRPNTAIIGAGIAGLACARALQDAGHPVTLFEKARGPGGRMASRHLGTATVDLGAQYFSVRDEAFQGEVEQWVAAGVVATWPTSHYRVVGNAWQAHSDQAQRYVGMPRMSAVTRHLARGLSLVTETRISRLAEEADGWWLSDPEGMEHGPFDRVVISIPAPQAQALVEPHDTTLASACRPLAQHPCWAAWVRFDAPLPAMPGVAPGWQAATLNDGPLRFVARNDHKPGRERQGESLTLLARTDWSEAQYDASADWVAEQLLAAFFAALPDGTHLPLPVATGAHRWRYAHPASHGDTRSHDYRTTASGLALCGDGWRGPRVEDAWLSGHHLGQSLTGSQP